MRCVVMPKKMPRVRVKMRLLGDLKGGLGVLAKLLLLPLMMFIASPVCLAQQQQVDDSLEIMEVFKQEAQSKQVDNKLTDEAKHKILFYMGLSLLVLLCTTAYLGVSMVVFNQEVFVKHMISAGLTVTLGLAHAVVAVVWFFPF